MSTSDGIELANVSKRFGDVQAVSEVCLTIEPGELIAVIGPSGCGKSTLLRMVADLESPSEGTISVFGKTPHEARLNQDYGIAFQQSGLLPWRSVSENIALPLTLRKEPTEARVEELLDLIGLRDFADHRPHQLSGGMQQRVAMARSLACKPALLLMDEPFGALDEMTRERLQSELRHIASETGAAVMLITHSISEAVFVADRVVVMSARPGRIRANIKVDLNRAGVDDVTLREAPDYYSTITEVREALRADQVTVGGAA